MKNEEHDLLDPTYKQPVTENGKPARPEILVITSYPPRECGLATYSQDLIRSLRNKFSRSFNISICALESEHERHSYGGQVKYILDTDNAASYQTLAATINTDPGIALIMIQHEFGLFEKREEDFIKFLEAVKKPVVTVFHTVLPHPSVQFKARVERLSQSSESVVVMTNTSRQILMEEYGIPGASITVIPHGTHLVNHADRTQLKEKHKVSGRQVLSTFGLLSSGKGIEVTLQALPAVISKHPDVLFLIIGKTHPGVVKQEGEQYRTMLEKMIVEMKLENHVKFINRYMNLPDLLEYLQLTDIYLFTSRDPHQAVSGTFCYAMSCGCPVISTPIPHAREVLADSELIVDFDNPQQLGEKIVHLLDDEDLRKKISERGLHIIASTAWENVAISFARLFRETINIPGCLEFDAPPLQFRYLKRMSTDFGIIQFAHFDQPDLESGYTLDDNARALIVACQHFQITASAESLRYIELYFNFIRYCMQPKGYFLNYVDKEYNFTSQNDSTSLADANGRAIWALGYLVSMKGTLPERLVQQADGLLRAVIPGLSRIYSTRAMAFSIKGLFYRDQGHASSENRWLIAQLANRLMQMYRHEANEQWKWFESYLTYANSVIPEALLCAWSACGEPAYKDIAKESFDFLLSQTFRDDCMCVISNKHWLYKGEGHTGAHRSPGGEQPIDVAYTILALKRFCHFFDSDDYCRKIETAFSWFHGNNHLGQIVYNPSTGGCYDGLEEKTANLNQGAESSVNYLMALLALKIGPEPEPDFHKLPKRQQRSPAGAL